MQLAKEFGSFGDVFKTLTAKLAILVTFLVGFPALYLTLPAEMQGDIPHWVIKACLWLGVLVGAGIIPGRAIAQTKTDFGGALHSIAIMAIMVGVLSFTLAACGPKTLPKPDNPQVAGTEALVAYGLAGSIAHDYFVLPDCTHPITALCKDPATAARLHVIDKSAHDAAVAADAAANDPTKQTTAATKLVDLKTAVDDPAVRSQVQH